MNKTGRLLVWAVPAALLIIEVLALSGTAPVPRVHLYLSPLYNSPLFTSTALAITLFSVRRSDITPLLVLGTLFEAGRFVLLVMVRHASFDAYLLSTGINYWYASLLISGWRVIGSRSNRLQELDWLIVKLAIPCSVIVTSFGLHSTAVLHAVYDNYFLAFDGLLPWPIAPFTAEVFSGRPVLSTVFEVVYQSLFFVFCAFVALQRGPHHSVRGHLISRWFLTGIIGFALYFVMPGIGPDIAFYKPLGRLPVPGDVTPTIMSTFVVDPRNAMPSLHGAWVYLLYICTYKMGNVIRLATLLYAMATVVATLGLREHYFIDLIVALPFAVAVHAAVSSLEGIANRNRNLLAVICGSALTGSWLLILRYGIEFMRSAPWIELVLVLCTMVFSAWLLFFCRERAVVAPSYASKQPA
jgi:hypothetical protein